MKFKVVLYETGEGFTAFCPGLKGCITEGGNLEEALCNARIAIREFMEASWIEMKEEIERDSQDSHVISVRVEDVEVNLDGVEEAEADEVATVS